jgi:hypothetical protein
MIRQFFAFSSSTQLIGWTMQEIGLVLSYDVEYGLLLYCLAMLIG